MLASIDLLSYPPQRIRQAPNGRQAATAEVDPRAQLVTCTGCSQFVANAADNCGNGSTLAESGCQPKCVQENHLGQSWTLEETGRKAFVRLGCRVRVPEVALNENAARVTTCGVSLCRVWEPIGF